MTTSATVTQFYNNVLQRDPSASELSSWTALIDSGALTSAQVLDAIVNSSEAQTFVAQVVRVYQAAFGRVPDTTGIDGWVDGLVAGTTTTTDLAAGFVLSAEWTARYGSTEVNVATLTGLYQNVLGRTPSGAEVDAWIATGLGLDQVLLGFANSAEFQANISSSVNTLLTTAGNTATASIGTVFDGTTSLGTGSGGTGQTFTLTTSIDNFTGTSQDDTFNAIETGGTDDTLGVADVLDGGAGTDTLSVVNTENGAIDPLTTSNIEVLSIRSTNNNNAAESLSLSSFSGVSSVILDDFVDGMTITNATLGTTVSITDASADNAADDINIGFASATGSSDAASVNTSNSTLQQLIVDSIDNLTLTNSGSTVTTIASLDANDAETITVANSTASVGSNPGLTVTAMGDNVATTMNFSGSGSTTFTGAMSTALATIDGSAATGALNLNVSTNTNNMTIALGSGDDRLNVGTVGTNLTTNDNVNLGSGTNTLAIADSTLTAADITNIKAVTGVGVLELTTTTAESAVDANAVGTIDAFKTTGAITDAAGAAGAAVADGDAQTVGNNGTAADNQAFSFTGIESGDSLSVEANLTGGAGGAASNGQNALAANTAGGNGGNGANGSIGLVLTPELDGGANAASISLTGGVTVAGGAGGNGGAGGTSTGTAANTNGGNGGNGAVGISATTVETLNISSTGSTANAIAGGAAGGAGAAGTGGSGGAGAAGAAGTAGASVAVNTNGTINVTGSADLNLGTISGTNASVVATNFTGKLTVTGEAGNNIITGGSAVDTIDGGAGIDTLTGNGGNDIFVFVDNQSTTANADSITDYTAGDIVRLNAADNVAGASPTSGTTATSNVEVSSGGKVTFAAADDTLAEKLVALAADTTDIAANEVVFFEDGGNTYIFNNVGGTDDLIKLTGVTGLTTLTESITTAGDFTLA